MKISDLIRSAESPVDQEKSWSNEYLGTEHDPEDELPVDEATEAEEADEIPSSEMESVTQGHKTIVDVGFLTRAEKELMRRCGWRIVAK